MFVLVLKFLIIHYTILVTTVGFQIRPDIYLTVISKLMKFKY